MAHRGHRFHKERKNTANKKKILANINTTSKKSSPAYCKQKRNCKKIHACTLQAKELHAANKTPARCKQKNYALQTKLPHTANKTPARCKHKTPARCKQNNYTLQTKFPHTANKIPARCKQKQKSARVG